MTKNSDYSEFPDIDKYAKAEKLSLEVLQKAFRLEEHYHQLLLEETHFDNRMKLYDEFYSRLIPIYGRDTGLISDKNPKDKYVKLFAKELRGSSIIDYGCGQGFMLQSIERNLSVKQLTGVDVFISDELKSHPKIQFIESNVITYNPGSKFDVAFSDNVLEHLVPADAELHLTNIYDSLNVHGKLIIIMPNRLFSPWDITRIQDFSQSGRLDAQGGHVNESTHFEMVEQLRKVGFKKFETILPFPKLKYLLFRRIRLDSKWMEYIEKSNTLLKLVKSIKWNGECKLKFPVLLIAEK